MSKIYKQVLSYFKQRDKQKHLLVGFGISLYTAVSFFSLFVLSKSEYKPLHAYLSALISFIFGAFAGAVKEWWDSKGHGTVEWADFFFTLLGALIGSALFLGLLLTCL